MRRPPSIHLPRFEYPVRCGAEHPVLPPVTPAVLPPHPKEVP
jgi:hypothetical protein